MAPKSKSTKEQSDPHGIFSGMVVFFVPNGVQARRLQIWKQRMVQMGAIIEERLSKRVTHVFAMDSHSLLHQLDSHRLSRFKGTILLYQWLEDSLKSGEKLSEDMYVLMFDPKGEEGIDVPDDKSFNPDPIDQSISRDPQQLQNKKMKSSSEDIKIVNLKSNEDRRQSSPPSSTSPAISHGEVESLNYADRRSQHIDAENEAVRSISLQLKTISLK